MAEPLAPGHCQSSAVRGWQSAIVVPASERQAHRGVSQETL
jgi:hypothetical protein